MTKQEQARGYILDLSRKESQRQAGCRPHKSFCRGLLSQLVAIALLVLAIFNIMSPIALADVSKQDLSAIDRTRETALKALNAGDFAKIAPLLHPSFTITTVDNQVFHKVDEFEKYWKQQLSGPIKNITMDAFKIDSPRTFLSDSTATSYGNAIATFSFRDGNRASMTMRWTAVLQKFQNKWTLQSLHFSSNLLDNPVLRGAQRMGMIFAIASGIGGFLLGAVAMKLWRRQRQRQTS